MRDHYLSIPLLSLIAFLAFPAAPTAEDDPDRKPWDASEMARLTAALVEQMGAIRAAYRNEPISHDAANPNRRAAEAMDEILRTLERSARQLQRRIAAGEGYEETLGVARKIGSLLRDAGDEGRKLMLSGFVQEHVDPAKATLNEIAPYYGSGPLYDPETGERVDR